MNAQQLLQTLMIVLLTFFILWLVLGCEALQERDKREGEFTVNADCEKDQIEVRFKLDQHGEEQQIEVKR